MIQNESQQLSKRMTGDRKPMLNYGDIPIPTEPVEIEDFENGQPMIGTLERN